MFLNYPPLQVRIRPRDAVRELGASRQARPQVQVCVVPYRYRPNQSVFRVRCIYLRHWCATRKSEMLLEPCTTWSRLCAAATFLIERWGSWKASLMPRVRFSPKRTRYIIHSAQCCQHPTPNPSPSIRKVDIAWTRPHDTLCQPRGSRCPDFCCRCKHQGRPAVTVPGDHHASPCKKKKKRVASHGGDVWS